MDFRYELPAMRFVRTSIIKQEEDITSRCVWRLRARLAQDHTGTC